MKTRISTSSVQQFPINGNSGPASREPRPPDWYHLYLGVLNPSCADPGDLKEPQTNLSPTLLNKLI